MKEIIVIHEIFQDYTPICNRGREERRAETTENSYNINNKHQTMDLLFSQKKHVYWLIYLIYHKFENKYNQLSFFIPKMNGLDYYLELRLNTYANIFC